MKLFKYVKEIKSKDGDLHFRRFAIFETSYFSLYIHEIYRADEDIYLHSHPWNFVSVILKGGYCEQNEKTFMPEFVSKKRWTITKMNRERFHKIYHVDNGFTTVSLCFTYGKKKPWFYSVDDEKIESKEFRRMKKLPQYNYLFKNRK